MSHPPHALHFLFVRALVRVYVVRVAETFEPRQSHPQVLALELPDEVVSCRCEALTFFFFKRTYEAIAKFFSFVHHKTRGSTY